MYSFKTEVIFFFFSFFGEDDWPRANICCQSSSFLLEEHCPWSNVSVSLPLVCVWDATTAWLNEQCTQSGSEPASPGQLKWSAPAQPQCHWAGPLGAFLNDLSEVSIAKWHQINWGHIILQWLGLQCWKTGPGYSLITVPHYSPETVLWCTAFFSCRLSQHLCSRFS